MTEWESHLSAAGCRITAPRQAVMRVLKTAAVPLSPQQILEQARTRHRKLGLVTVYRTLSLLSELNLVHRVHQSNGCHGYLRASPGHRHLLICQSCERAVEFPGEDNMYALIERVEDRTGYQVDEHLLQLLGLCPDCQQREK